MLTQDRHCFAREPAYYCLLRREFEEHGCKFRLLNDRGDDSPEGELTDGIPDQLATYERSKIAERTRREKLRKAREGKMAPPHAPNYGFENNDARDNPQASSFFGELLLLKQLFRNEDGSESVLYLVYSDLPLDYQRITTIYQRRWTVEEYNKSGLVPTAAAP